MAITAAFISLRSAKVSSKKRSTPPSRSAPACSVKVSNACEKVNSPKGLTNLPVGPIIPATLTFSPATFFAFLAAV